MRKIDCGIYKLENFDNKKIYVGQSKYLIERKQGHFARLKNGNHHNTYLQVDFNNGHTIKFSTLETINKYNKDLLYVLESKWINKFISSGIKVYNTTRYTAKTNKEYDVDILFDRNEIRNKVVSAFWQKEMPNIELLVDDYLKKSHITVKELVNFLSYHYRVDLSKMYIKEDKLSYETKKPKTYSNLLLKGLMKDTGLKFNWKTNLTLEEALEIIKVF